MSKIKLPKIPKEIFLPHIAFILVQLIWGAANPIIKATLPFIPPFTFLYLRFLIVGILVFPYLAMALKRQPIHKQDYLNFFLLGLFSQTSIILVFWALKYTTALDVGIISIVAALLTVYSGHFFYNEKIDNRMKIGLAIASIGTLAVIIEPVITRVANNTPLTCRVLGNILALIYNLLYVAYIVWSKMSMGQDSKVLKRTLKFINIKPMKKTYSPALIVCVTFYVGLLTIMPFALLEVFGVFGEEPFDIFSMGPQGWAGVLYMAGVSSIVAYILNQWALSKTEVSDQAIYSYIHPLFVVPFAYLFLNEVPNKVMIISTFFIVIGVIIAEKANMEHRV